MLVRLRRPSNKAKAPAIAGEDAPEREGPKRLSHREFLKTLAIGLAGAGALALENNKAEATYTPGSPSDIVNTNLEVQGDLKITNSGRLAIGPSGPATTLDVTKSITANGTPHVQIGGVISAASNTDTGYALSITPAFANSYGTNTNKWYGVYVAPSAWNYWTNIYGAYIVMPNGGTSCVEGLHIVAGNGGNYSRGLVVETPSGGAHRAGLTIGAPGTSGGVWALYCSSGDDSYFAGDVGIRKPVPNEPLDVVGNIQATGNIKINGVVAIDAATVTAKQAFYAA